MKEFELAGEVAYDKEDKQLGTSDEGGFIDGEGESVDGDLIYYVNPIIEVDGEDVSVLEPICVDWKETPDEVIEQVNAFLAQQEADIEFVAINYDDDAYHFGVLPLTSDSK